MKYSLTYNGKNYSFEHPDRLDEQQALSIVKGQIGETTPASVLSQGETESVTKDYPVFGGALYEGLKGAGKGVGQFVTRQIPQAASQLPVMAGKEMQQGTSMYEPDLSLGWKENLKRYGTFLTDTISGKFMTRLIGKPIADWTGLDEAQIKLGSKIATENDKFMRAHPEMFEASGNAEKVGMTLGNAGGSLLTALGLTYLTRSPDAAAVFFGALQKGSMYKEATDAGLSHDAADRLSTAAGVAEGALEYIGLDAVTRRLRGSAPFKRWLLSSMSEFMQEASQQTAEETIAKFGWNRPGSAQEIMGRILESGAVGFLMGAPTAVVTNFMENKGELKELRDKGFNDGEIEQMIELARGVAEKKQSELESTVKDLGEDKSQLSKIEITKIVDKVSRVGEDQSAPADLLSEVRKYDTAEEFVKAQNKQISSVAKNVLEKPNTPLSNFAHGKENIIKEIQSVSEYKGKPINATVFQNEQGKYRVILHDESMGVIDAGALLRKDGENFVIENIANQETINNAIPILKKVIKENLGKVILDEDAPRIKSKSQLTSIWNKAHKTAPEQSLIAEAKKYKTAEEFVNSKIQRFSGQVSLEEQLQNYQNTLKLEKEKLSTLRSSNKQFKQRQQIYYTESKISELKENINWKNQLLDIWEEAHEPSISEMSSKLANAKYDKAMLLISKRRTYEFLKNTDKVKEIDKQLKEIDITPSDLSRLSDAQRISLFYAKMLTSRSSSHASNIAKKYKPEQAVFDRYTESMKQKYSAPAFEEEKTLNMQDADTKKFFDSFKGYKKVVSKRYEGKPISISRFRDIQLAAEKLEAQTGYPFGTIFFPDVIDGSNSMFYYVDLMLEDVTSGINMKNITPEGDIRISKYVDSGGQENAGMTADEIHLGNNLMNAFKYSKIPSRFGNGTISIQQLIQFLKLKTNFDAKKSDMDILKESNIPPQVLLEAREAYAVGGNRALEKFVIEGKYGFGLMKEYTPAEAQKTGVLRDTYYDEASVYDPHIKPRRLQKEAVESGRPLMVKVHRYFSRVYGDYFMQDAIHSLDEYLDKINLDVRSRNDINNWYKLVKGLNIDVGAFGHVLRKTRSMFFKTLFIDPYKNIRNLLQPLPFFAPKYRTGVLARKLTGYKNFKLSQDDVQYFMLHVNQLKNLKRDWMYLEQMLFKGGPLRKVEDIASKISSMYAWTDYADRFVSYGISLVGTRNDIDAYKDGKLTLTQFAKRNGLDNLSENEIARMLTRGKDEAARYIARTVVEKSFWRYSKTQRGLAYTTDLGEFGGSLLTFPKGVLQETLRNLSNLTGIGRAKGSPLDLAKRWSGLKNIVGIMLLGEVANTLLRLLAGEREYYDPIRRKNVLYKPYGYKEMLMGIGFGGAQVEHLIRVKNVLAAQAEIITINVNPNKTATDVFRSRALTRKMATDLDYIAEAHVPFLKKGMDLLESVFDLKRLHPLTTMVDKMHGKDFDVDDEIKRDFIGSAIHTIFGTEAAGAGHKSPMSIKSMGVKDKTEFAIQARLSPREIRELMTKQSVEGELASKLRDYKEKTKELEDRAKLAIEHGDRVQAYLLYLKAGKTSKARQALTQPTR